MESNPIWGIVNTLLIALITAAVPVIGAYAVAALNQLQSKLKAQAGEARWAQITAIVGAAVASAEQVGLSGEIRMAGEAKKVYALTHAQKFLDAQGVKLDLQALSALIEAEVLKLKWPLMVPGGGNPPAPDLAALRVR